MPNKPRHTVALRIQSAALTAAEISDVLGTQPTRAIEKGVLYSAYSTKPKLREAAVWLLNSDSFSGPSLDDRLNGILDFMDSGRAELQALARTCYMDLSCGYFDDNGGNGGIALTREMFARIAGHNVCAFFDLYLGDSELRDE